MLGSRVPRTLAGAVLALVTVAGFVGIAAPAAGAATPTAVSNLHPTDTLANGLVLSDRNDGVDQTAHVTAAATPDTAAVEWFACPDSYSGANPTASGSGCESEGLDNTPTVPPAGTPGGDTDAAFGFNWDIPASLDDHTVAWVAWACTDATNRTAANCIQDVDHGVVLEDAAGATSGQDTAGEITTAAVAHGSSVPGDASLDVKASTSSDVDELTFCIADPAGADEDNTACTVSHADSTPDTTGLNSETWSATFTAAEVPDNSEFVVAIENTSGGTNNCDATTAATMCRLDDHYVVSTLNANGKTAKLSFPNASTPAKHACDSSVNTTVTNDAGSTETVEGCVFDNASTPNPITDSVDWVFTITPEDTSAACFSGEGTETGTSTKDTCAETVLGDPGDAGGNDQADQSITLNKTGDYTITFCEDTNDNGACDSGEPTATGTKTVGPGPATTDRTRFAADAPAGSDCKSGQTQQSFTEGTNVDVVECVFDAQGNPVPGQDGVQWSIFGPGDFAAVEDTTDGSGQAHATVENGVAGQQTTVSSCVDTNGNGTCDIFGNDVTINWTQAPPSQGPDTLSLRQAARHRTGRHRGWIKLAGELVGDSSGSCFGNEGGILIQIHRGLATGAVVATATTQTGGAYHTGRITLRLRRTRVRHFTATTNGSPNCQAATSNTIKVHGFR